ncbi:hypothetical protein ACJ41O_014316 [Fusarium nematophilum]
MLALNPIISGFAPDPSITRIGSTYFLVNSSFHLYPGIPIYASTNLVDWKHIGNGVNRPTQLNFSRSRTLIHRGGETILVGTGGLWAPTIRHHGGITYIICTNVIHTKADGLDGEPVWPSFENFIIQTTDILSGEWSDPLFYDFNGIDPDLFIDQDGRAYVTGSSWNSVPGTINGFEIDLKSGDKLSEEVVIWEGVLKHIPEGPHIYKKNGGYFLLIAEGGTHDNHQMSIAKSKSPLGPYEPCPHNPILKPTANLKTEVVYTGHGDLFQDLDDRWWLTCLGVRKTSEGDSIMGRETFLTPVRWADEELEDPWPMIEQPIGTTVSLPSPSGPPAALPMCKGNFASHAGVDCVWIRHPDLAAYKTSWEDRTVSLKPSLADLKGDGTEPITFVGKRQRRLSGESRAVLSIPSLSSQTAITGLVYYKDEHRHASISFDSVASTIVSELINRGKRDPICRRETVATLTDTKDANVEDIEFRLIYSVKSLQFYYRLRLAGGNLKQGTDVEASWLDAGTFDTVAMTDQDFTGPVIGLFATVQAETTSAAASEWCDFSQVNLVDY